MLDFYKTVGGRKFCDHTIPELIRKLDKVADLDFDGLTKAMNRLAKSQEEANRLEKGNRLQERGKTPEGRDVKLEAWKLDFLQKVMVQLNKADASGIVLKDEDAEIFLSATHLVNDFPLAFSIEDDWIRIWKVGISDNQADREVEQILKAMRESDRDSIPCSEEIAKLIRDNPRVSSILKCKGVKIDDAFGIMSLTKPMQSMSDEEIFNFVERLTAEIGEGGLTVRGKPYRTIRENDQVRAVLMAKGVRIEMDEEDDSADLYIGEAE